MKKKLFLIITILLFTSSISFSQYDLSVKAYGTYGFISPSQINNHFKKLDEINFETGVKQFNKNKPIDDFLGLGFELDYNVLNNLGVGIGFEIFKKTSLEYGYYQIGSGFFQPLLQHNYKMNYDLSIIFIKSYYKYKITSRLTSILSFCPIISFSKLSEDYLGYLYITKGTGWNTDQKYSLNKQSNEFGYIAEIGIDYNFYSRFSLEVCCSYKSIVHEFEGDFSMAKENKVEFNLSGFYISAGLKIGIL